MSNLLVSTCRASLLCFCIQIHCSEEPTIMVKIRGQVYLQSKFNSRNLWENVVYFFPAQRARLLSCQLT